MSSLGKKSIAHAAKSAGYERHSTRINGKLVTRYIKDELGFEDMTEIITRLGLFQRNDSDKEIEESEDTVDKTYDKLVELL